MREVLARGGEHAAEAAYQLGQLAGRRFDYPAADRYDQEAVALRRDNAGYLTAAGVNAYAQGQYARAEPLFQRALAIRERTLGPDHPAVATMLTNLAACTAGKNSQPRLPPRRRGSRRCRGVHILQTKGE